MKTKGLGALALVFAMLCVTTSALGQPLPEEDDVPQVPVVDCADPGEYQEPNAAPEPADPLTSAACRARGKVVDGGPASHPAPFEEEGDHPTPASDQPQEPSDDGGPEGGDPEETDTPTPNRPWTQTNGAMTGIQTADGYTGQYGVYSALTVRDSRVPRGSSQYLSQRVMAKSCDRLDWLEIGWVEAGWRDNKQYIYTQDTPGTGWRFYDQYPLTPGQVVYVQVVQVPTNPNLWQAYLYWNGSWQLLRETVNSNWLGCGGEVMVDRYQTGQGTWFNIDGQVTLGDGTPTGVQVKNVGTNSWQSWNNTFPTATYTGSSQCWDLRHVVYAQWFWGYTESNNCAPNTVVSVTPTSGTRLTDFQASLAGTIDWNGDAITSLRIDWGDGTSDYPASVNEVRTHRYANAGSYQVRGFACDDRGPICAYSNPQSVHVDTTNSAPVTSFNVTPTSGDRTTTFNANFNGTYDPENDPISYRIEWGDGAANNSQSASHRYQNAGTYTVTGRACDSFGACSTQSRTVTVAFSNQAPNANLTVSPKTGDRRTTFSATLTGSDPDGDSISSYRIDWGDGTTTTGQNGTHIYESPGRYDVVGTVTDQYGLAGSDEEAITVCAVYEGGQCVETPERPKPPPLPVPGPVSSAVARVVQQRPEVTKVVRSSTNSIMVLNANLIQAYARGHKEYTKTCTADSHKTCGAGTRLTQFVDRIEALVEKPDTPTGDGMGGVVPDVIVLQEVLTPHADAIARKLSGRFDMANRVDFMFETAMSFDHADIPNEEAERTYCAEQNPGATPAQIEECEDQIVTKGDVAIIYNHDTVEMMPGTQRVVENRYSPDERCIPEAPAPPGGWDFDNDNQADCRYAKWKRQLAVGFQEIRRNGTTTGYEMAVASTHLVTASHFDNGLTPQEVEEGVEEEPEANANHERRKLQWSDQMARELATIPADSFVIAGDLNIHRCSTKNHKERGDYPQGAECGPRAWYTNLTSEPVASPLPPPGVPDPTAEPAPEPRGYADTIWFLHEDEDDRLVPQYRDGLLPNNGGQRYRTKRIDYIFTRSAELLGSSNDLTCGQNPPRGLPPNCFDDYRNPDYYSDHRITWTLLSD